MEWVGALQKLVLNLIYSKREKDPLHTPAFIFYEVIGPQRLWNQSNEMQTTSFGRVVLIADCCVRISKERAR